MEFINNTVLITGATSGIGRACALAFARLGARVYANCLKEDSDSRSLMKQANDENLNVIVVPADVRSSESIAVMMDKIYSLGDAPDILVNNAGASIVKPFLDMTEADWDFIFDTDVKSVFLCSQAVIPAMQKKQYGIIVNIASELGFSGREKFCAYTAAKGAVITLTRSMAREFAPHIRVNAVAPGPTKTPLLDKEIEIADHDEDISAIPLGRYGTAEEIAESVVFLASEKASFYCGDIISPNGGAIMR